MVHRPNFYPREMQDKDTVRSLAAEPANKLFFKTGRDSFGRRHWRLIKGQRSGSPSLSFLDESWRTIFIVPVAMFNYDPWFQEFNEMMGMMIDHGIVSDYYSRRQLKMKEDEIPVLVLTMDHL